MFLIIFRKLRQPFLAPGAAFMHRTMAGKDRSFHSWKTSLLILFALLFGTLIKINKRLILFSLLILPTL